MASPIALGFHAQKMVQEQERVHLRISYGTKASTPEIRNQRRLNPLYYSNPLPDNSSGSKMRPFFGAKDESGRPNAMELVAMRQKGELSGGVLKDYRYARKVLEQRARDTQNVELESQGLPPVPAPILQLDDIESRIMELSTLLSGINDAIDDGDITQLTVNELKNIPRLLVAIAPALTEAQITDMINYINDIVLSLTSAENLSAPVKRASSRIKAFFVGRVIEFLKALMDIVNVAPADKMNAIRGFSKQFFDIKPEKRQTVSEVEPIPEPEPVRRRRPQLAPQPEGEEAPAEGEEEGEEEEAPAPAQVELAISREDFTQQKQAVKEALKAPSARDLNRETIIALYRNLPGSQARMTDATTAQIRNALVRRVDKLAYVRRDVDKFVRWYNEQYTPNENNLE